MEHIICIVIDQLFAFITRANQKIVVYPGFCVHFAPTLNYVKVPLDISLRIREEDVQIFVA